jgi:hypothetical protein
MSRRRDNLTFNFPSGFPFRGGNTVKIYRRRFLQSATAFVVTATPRLVRAQAWPARPVRGNGIGKLHHPMLGQHLDIGIRVRMQAVA